MASPIAVTRITSPNDPLYSHVTDFLLAGEDRLNFPLGIWFAWEKAGHDPTFLWFVAGPSSAGASDEDSSSATAPASLRTLCFWTGGAHGGPGIWVSDGPAEDAAALARALAAACDDSPGMLEGPGNGVRSFAVAFCEAREGRFTATPLVELMVHRLDALRDDANTDPSPPTGFMRPARCDNTRDVALVLHWRRGFIKDTALPGRPPPSLPSLDDEDASCFPQLAAGTLYVWEVEGSGPVAMAAWNRKTPNGCCVSLVYTPPEHRRRGHCHALVRALSALLLHEPSFGNRFVTLFTDLANPTSNAIYRRIGYRALGEVTSILALDPAPVPASGS